MPVSGNKTNEVQVTSPNKVKVKTTNTEVLKENLARNGSEYTNSGEHAIWLGLGKAAVENEGVGPIEKGGNWNGLVGGMVWTGSVFGIAPGGETTLTVVEV